MVESVGGPRGGGLPCGGCQRFESAYLQLVSLVGTKLYDSTPIFRFGSSIYDLSFMDVDKILPFSSTLGWHSLKVKGEAPRDEEGRSKRRNASGVENKRRSGDSRIVTRGKESKSDSRSSGERNGSSLNRENGLWESNTSVVLLGEAVECCTLDGESPVAESITSLCSDPSSMGHVESRVNQQGPPCKAKYSWVTDSEAVAWLREPTGAVAKASLNRAIVTAYGPEPGASWFSPKCVEAQQLTGHLGVKHCFGAGRESDDGDKLHRREGNSPDHQLRPLNDRSVIKEEVCLEAATLERVRNSSLIERSCAKMNGLSDLRSCGCKNASVGAFRLEEAPRERGGRSGSENVGLSNATLVRIQCPENLRVPPQGSSTEGESGPKIRPKGVVDGQQANIPVLPLLSRGRRRLGKKGREMLEQCPSTRRYGAEVTCHTPGKARTTSTKGTRQIARNFGRRGASSQGVAVTRPGDCYQNTGLRKVVRPCMGADACPVPEGEPATEAPVNGGRNYNGPKVAKFLVGKFRPARKAVTIWALSRREARCGLPAPGQKDPMKLHCSLDWLWAFPAQLRWKAKKAPFGGGPSRQ
uniref:Uncharacterized protein ycf68 n=1 Tax=Salix viminalis TaxID=40686 RepID=A0A6N2L9E4_SALVM